MSNDNVVQFPPSEKPPELLVGPFEEYRVVVEGRRIPGLTGHRSNDGISLIVDGRFSVTVPEHMAYDVAWLIANAMAVAGGYAYLGSERKGDRPFAPLVNRIDTMTE
jgi:hypothetical protein